MPGRERKMYEVNGVPSFIDNGHPGHDPELDLARDLRRIEGERQVVHPPPASPSRISRR